jgi:hypothetical protein
VYFAKVERTAQENTPILGTVMLQSREGSTKTMKLMGAPRLFRMVGASAAARGASSALLAELDAGVWRSRAEVVGAFPHSNWQDGRLVIALDEWLCVVIAFNYEREIALIEFAGPSLDREESPPMRPRIRL